jgi:hypothetical protein
VPLQNRSQIHREESICNHLYTGTSVGSHPCTSATSTAHSATSSSFFQALTPSRIAFIIIPLHCHQKVRANLRPDRYYHPAGNQQAALRHQKQVTSSSQWQSRTSRWGRASHFLPLRRRALSQSHGRTLSADAASTGYIFCDHIPATFAVLLDVYDPWATLRSSIFTRVCLNSANR